MIFRRFNQENKTLNKFSNVNPQDITRDHFMKTRYRDRENTVLHSSGKPFKWYIAKKEFSCYCQQRNSGNTNDPACFGTGYLHSYEKYGYKTFTFAKTTQDLVVQNIRWIDGWGYKELATLNRDSDTGYIVYPWIETVTFKAFNLSTVFTEQGSSGFVSFLEFSYDDNQWFELDELEDIDLTMKQVRFRVVLKRTEDNLTGGIRFSRFQFRELDFFTDTDFLDIPEDVYILVSIPQKQKVYDVTKEREKTDLNSIHQGWCLNEIHADDFIVDVTGVLNGSVNDIYLINNVALDIHGNDGAEYRRDFDLKLIAHNSFLRRLYSIT